MTLVYDADNIDIDLKAMESLIEQVSPLSILETARLLKYFEVQEVRAVLVIRVYLVSMELKNSETLNALYNTSGGSLLMAFQMFLNFSDV